MQSVEPLVRGGVFLAVLGAMMCWERIAPRRSLTQPVRRRWVTNLSLLVASTVLARALSAAMPALAAAAAADLARAARFGLLNQVHAPPALAVALTFVVMDFSVWLQHVLMHRLGLLWRFHRVHHADRDLDATTALRFHPGEIVLSAVYKSLVAAVLGAPAGAVIAFEVALNAFAVFNHANVAVPDRLDRVLRRLVVTPDMHRIHHSVNRQEQDSNFGFCLSVWDRLAGCLVRTPQGGHDGMRLGLQERQDASPGKLVASLTLPFRD